MRPRTEYSDGIFGLQLELHCFLCIFRWNETESNIHGIFGEVRKNCRRIVWSLIDQKIIRVHLELHCFLNVFRWGAPMRPNIPCALQSELGMSTEIEYSGKYEYRNFFASKYG